MRTIVLHLRSAGSFEVSELLSRSYRPGQGMTWQLEKDGDPVLYIGIYQHLDSEYEAEELSKLIEFLGARPSVSIYADVSGRHDGLAEVLTFVRTILGTFDGVAHDDFSDHSWTLAEIEAGRLHGGHPFFDFRGWHEENRRK